MNPGHALLLAALAAGCGQGSHSGESTSGAITGTSGTMTPSSGSSSTGGAAGSSGEGGGSGSATTGASTGSGGSGSAISGASAGAGSTTGSGASAGGSSGSASTRDAGTNDAGNTGAGGEGGAAGGCAGKTYKLCEDFESGAVGSIPTGWTALRGYSADRGGTVLANDQAHSGTMSLKSDSIEPGQDRIQRSLASLGPTATKHWGRIFYKVGTPAPKPNTSVLHITFTALEGTTENRVVDTVINTGGSHQWLFNIPSDKCCTSSAYDWTFDTSWHCAEWMVDVPLESFRFFSDGKEVTALAFTGNAGALMSSYMNVGLGTIFYQTPPTPVVVWFDDLAIDDTQIGCQ